MGTTTKNHNNDRVKCKSSCNSLFFGKAKNVALSVELKREQRQGKSSPNTKSETDNGKKSFIELLFWLLFLSVVLSTFMRDAVATLSSRSTRLEGLYVAVNCSIEATLISSGLTLPQCQ